MGLKIVSDYIEQVVYICKVDGIQNAFNSVFHAIAGHGIWESFIVQEIEVELTEEDICRFFKFNM